MKISHIFRKNAKKHPKRVLYQKYLYISVNNYQIRQIITFFDKLLLT